VEEKPKKAQGKKMGKQQMEETGGQFEEMSENSEEVGLQSEETGDNSEVPVSASKKPKRGRRKLFRSLEVCPGCNFTKRGDLARHITRWHNLSSVMARKLAKPLRRESPKFRPGSGVS